MNKKTSKPNRPVEQETTQRQVTFFVEDEINKNIFQEDLDLIQKSFDVRITDSNGTYRITANDVEQSRKAAIVLSKICRDIENELTITDEIIKEYIQPLLFEQDEGVSHKPLFKEFNGKYVYPRTKNQEAFVKSIKNYICTIVVGPAGTGKTKLAVTVALNMLSENRYDSIKILRPTVSVASNSLGFLKGDLAEKYGPYCSPVVDTFIDLIGEEYYETLIRNKKIEFVPVAMIRGANFQNSFVIAEETQNLNKLEIISILSRLCYNCTVVLNGDFQQSDLKSKGANGLAEACERLKDLDDVNIVKMTSKDVQRNKIVGEIIEAFED